MYVYWMRLSNSISIISLRIDYSSFHASDLSFLIRLANISAYQNLDTEKGSAYYLKPLWECWKWHKNINFV
jgi:hypothetical protein